MPKFKILELDKPTQNNRIYPKEVMEQAIKDKPKYGVIDSTNDYFKTTTSIRDMSHVIDSLEIVDNKLIADIKILDNDNGKLLQQLIDDNLISFNICGKAIIEKDDKSGVEIIKNLKLIYVNAYLKKK